MGRRAGPALAGLAMLLAAPAALAASNARASAVTVHAAGTQSGLVISLLFLSFALGGLLYLVLARRPSEAPVIFEPPAAEATAPRTDRIARTTLAYLSLTAAEREQGVAGPVEQEALIREACAQRGWRLQGVLYDDPGALANGGPRAAFEQVMERIESGDAGCLVVSRLDRLGRSTVELGDALKRLEEHAATVVALDFDIDTATSTGIQISEVLAGMAEHEREKIAAGTRTGLAAVRAQGRPISRPSVSDLPQLRERIHAMRESGMTLQKIADTLNEEGVPTLRGGACWRPSSVQSASGYKRPRRSAAARNGNGRPPDAPPA